jgi:hypothetical protein
VHAAGYNPRHTLVRWLHAAGYNPRHTLARWLHAARFNPRCSPARWLHAGRFKPRCSPARWLHAGRFKPRCSPARWVDAAGFNPRPGRLRWLLAPLLLLLAAACGGGEGGEGSSPSPPPVTATLPPIPTQAPQPSPTPVNAHPAGTRTGVAVIDGVLAALEAGDAAALTGLLSFHPYRCDNAPAGTEGANPCPPGVAAGSPVDVVAAGGCEVEFLARQRAGLAAEIAGYVAAAGGQRVYAVTEVQEGRLASPLPLRYLIILAGGHTLLLDDAGVTHLGLPCDNVGPAQLFHPRDRAILAPV